MYVKCTTNWTITSQILLYHNAYNMYQNSVHDEQYICSSCDKILKETSDENPVVPHYARYAKCSHRSILSKGTESKT